MLAEVGMCWTCSRDRKIVLRKHSKQRREKIPKRAKRQMQADLDRSLDCFLNVVDPGKGVWISKCRGKLLEGFSLGNDRTTSMLRKILAENCW